MEPITDKKQNNPWIWDQIWRCESNNYAEHSLTQLIYVVFKHTIYDLS